MEFFQHLLIISKHFTCEATGGIRTVTPKAVLAKSGPPWPLLAAKFGPPRQLLAAKIGPPLAKYSPPFQDDGFCFLVAAP